MQTRQEMVPPTEAEEPAGASGRASAPRPGSCALLGSEDSGRTGFLAALHTAFECRDQADWTRFVELPPRGEPADAAARADQEGGPRGDRPASPPPWSTRTFQLGMRPGGADAGREPEELEISVLDTPCDFFDGLAARDRGESTTAPIADLIRATRNARCLVLFVGTGDDGAPPLDLAGVVGGLLGDGPTRLPRLGAKAWPGSEPPWQRAARLELPFERVLVLLTGVEVLGARVAEKLACAVDDWLNSDPAQLRTLAAYSGLDAWQVAEQLDVPALLRERVRGLELLASSLKPGALIAASALSASGFAPQPTPPGRSDNDFGRRRERADRAGVPFGVWPALLFMATGRVVAPLTLIERREDASTTSRPGGLPPDPRETRT